MKVQNVKVDYADVLREIKCVVQNDWQKQCNLARWELHDVKPVLGDYPMVSLSGEQKRGNSDCNTKNGCVFSHQ